VQLANPSHACFEVRRLQACFRVVSGIVGSVLIAVGNAAVGARNRATAPQHAGAVFAMPSAGRDQARTA
jgi:hypothetical protein